MRDNNGRFIRGHEVPEKWRKKLSYSHSLLSPQEHPHWKGGRILRAGYIMVYSPDHPHANYGGYVFEHRLIIEKSIGRYLDPKEVVHHLNGDTQDNRIENLILLPNDKTHKVYHRNRIKRYINDDTYNVGVFYSMEVGGLALEMV